MIKIATAACAVTLLLAPAAFAQSAGTSLGGTSNGMEGTPGQSSATSGSSDMRGPGTAGSSGGSGGVATGTGSGSANTTATGGNAGGNASKN